MTQSYIYNEIAMFITKRPYNKIYRMRKHPVMRRVESVIEDITPKDITEEYVVRPTVVETDAVVPSIDVEQILSEPDGGDATLEGNESIVLDEDSNNVAEEVPADVTEPKRKRRKNKEKKQENDGQEEAE